jgi:hypothetical protein
MMTDINTATMTPFDLWSQIDGKKRSVELVNFSQLMNARWLRRLSDLSQRHRTSLKYHHRLGLFPETA